MNDEERFEELWMEHIKKDGKNYGRFYNGLNRRKIIARQFYFEGVLVAWKDINSNKSLETKQESNFNKKHATFILEDDNEVMTSALDDDSGLDEENKSMNRDLIKKHQEIMQKIDLGDNLTKEDIILLRDANEMDLNDTDNIREHHKESIEFGKWLEEELKRL